MKKHSPWLKTLFLLLLLASAACGKKSKSPQLQPFAKDENAQAACETLNLARDASWTAGFVRSFLSCLSASESKFTYTLALMDSMAESGVQAVLDLLRWNTETEKDPLLSALSTLLDRGTQRADGTDIVDEKTRWDGTQAFLESTKPYAAMQLLLELQDKQMLTEAWDLIRKLEAQLPSGFQAAMLRAVLSDEQTRADLKSILDALVKNPESYEGLKTFLTAKPFAMAEACPQAAACPYPEAATARTTVQHWMEFWKSLDQGRQIRIRNLLSQIMLINLEQGESMALTRGKQFYDLAEDSILRSKSLYSQYAEVLSVLRQTPLSSFEPMIKGLDGVKDNPIYRDAFEEKIGSTYLQDLIEDLLWKGGQPKGCSRALPGLETAGTHLKDAYAKFLNPQAECSGQVPLLLALSERMGWECPQDLCTQSLQSDQTIDNELPQLLSFAMDSLEHKLLEDPWYLYHKGAARSALNQEQWAGIKRSIVQFAPRNLTDLLRLEAQLAADASLRKLLGPDWLEQWLDSEILELSSLEDSFQGLFPDRDPIEQWYFSDADVRMSRVLFGLYPGGPGVGAQNEVFNLAAAKAAWYAFKPDTQIDDRDLSRLLATLRNSFSQFKNPLVSFKAAAEKLSLPWVGGTKNSVRFTADGQTEANPTALSLGLLFEESADGLALRSRFKDQLVLASASLPQNESDAFQAWLLNTWLPQQEKAWKGQARAQARIPYSLFDRTPLKTSDSRFMALFLSQQFLLSLQQVPEDTRINSLPVSNQASKQQAARMLSGPASFGGGAWTSLWAFDSGLLSESHQSLRQILDSIDSDEGRLNTLFQERLKNPLLLNQGMLDPAESALLDAHEKMLMQLHLSSPIFQNRGKQFFAPSLGFAAYCPLKGEGTSWSGTACPFQAADFAAYRRLLQDRVAQSLCSLLKDASGQVLTARAKALGLKDSSSDLTQICGSDAPINLWPKAWLDAVAEDAIGLGRNPLLKGSVRQLPSDLRYLKAQRLADPRQRFEASLAQTPILTGAASARMLQRMGISQAFVQQSPNLLSSLVLHLSARIGNAGVSESLKRLSSQGLVGSNAPVQDLLGLISERYRAAQAAQLSTLAYSFDLLTALSDKPYAREILFRLFAKPSDPNLGILLGFTLPQAVKADILSDFNWKTYAPLRLVLQTENQATLQRLLSIYDRDALAFFDHWNRIQKVYPDAATMAKDAEDLIFFLQSYMEQAEAKLGKSAEFMRFARVSSLDAAVPAAVRFFRLLNKALPDLDNEWQKPFAQQSEALAATALECLPLAWDMGNRLTAGSNRDNILTEATLGLLWAPARMNAPEMLALFQDQRVGLRKNSFWPKAWYDSEWQNRSEALLAALQKTERSDWLAIQGEWQVLGPHFARSLRYMADNIVWKSDAALPQKAALLTLADTVQSPERWESSQKLFEAWLDDRSNLDAWQKEEAP